MQRFELPCAAFFHEAVLEDAFAPGAFSLIHARHREFAAARLRGAAIGRDVGDNLQLQMIVEHPFGDLGTRRLEELSDAALSGVDAAEPHFDGAVGREQIRHFVPHAAIHVVAIDPLQVLDLLLVLKKRHAADQIRGSFARVALSF